MALLCPILQEQQFTDNGEFLVGGLMWFYEAGTSTLANSYTTEDGDVAWSNPIILNSRGESGGTIWLDADKSYRIVVENKPYYGQTHGTVIVEHDNINGIPVSVSAEQWITFDGVPTYISVTSFTVPNDYRDIFVTDRKLLITDSGGTSVNTVTSSSFGFGVTTVNITGSIDSGISLVQYSFITPDASPNRFTDITVTNSVDVTNDLTVGDDVTIGGDATITGDLTIGGNAAWTNANNTFGTSTSPNTGFISFSNGIKFYRETKAITFTSSGATVSVSYSDTFSSPFATACFQVVATLGDLGVTFSQYSPLVSVKNVTASGFDYEVMCRAAVPNGTYNLTLIYLAIGY